MDVIDLRDCLVRACTEHGKFMQYYFTLHLLSFDLVNVSNSIWMSMVVLLPRGVLQVGAGWLRS